MGNDRWRERGGGGRGGKGVNSIINTCLFGYCSLLGIFCTENIISKKNGQVLNKPQIRLFRFHSHDHMISIYVNF